MKIRLLSLGLALVAPVLAQTITLPASSPRAGVSQEIGITKISVDYSRPAVNKREIWGKLVPYGLADLGFGTTREAPWRAGADVNTVVTFQHDVRVAGQPLAAGAYGLHMILAADGGVTVIFSRDHEAWGSFFYDPAHDALRVPSKLEDSAAHHELLTYEFSDITKNGAVLSLLWEKKRIAIPVTVDTDAIVVASLKRELTGTNGFDDRAWSTASNYLVQNNLDLNLALEWAERAVNPRTGQVTFAGLSQKAAVLEKLGRSAEATAVMDQALPLGTALTIHQYGRRLLAAKQTEKALEVFKFNAQRFPDVWPVNYGLARGYSAVGNYPAALEALLKAQKQVPAGDTVNAAAIATNIEKLKRGENIN